MKKKKNNVFNILSNTWFILSGTDQLRHFLCAEIQLCLQLVKDTGGKKTKAEVLSEAKNKL